jgi:hypothetical protein
MEFERVPVNDKLYNCYDIDVPLTCNGYGIDNDFISKFNYSAPCPYSWTNRYTYKDTHKPVINGWLDDPTTPVTYNSNTKKLHQGAYYDYI